jgi:hypothetical protein
MIMKYLFLLAFLCNTSFAFAQMSIPFSQSPAAKEILKTKLQTTSAEKRTRSGTPNFDTLKWPAAVDSFWGYGPSDSMKLAIFDTFWLAQKWGNDCFVGLPMYNWDSIAATYRAEIAAGVSRGKFAGIMDQLAFLLNDAHGGFLDRVITGAFTTRGAPVFETAYGTFGACISAIQDTIAVVYDVEPNHVLGIKRGDIILGYNGIGWMELLKIIRRHRLPTYAFYGSSPKSTLHKLVQSVGQNWHLFDTIDIKKCDGSIVHLALDSMNNSLYYSWCKDQMLPPELPQLSLAALQQGKNIVSDRIPNSNIAYVAMYDCNSTPDKLKNALKIMVDNYNVDGFIIDIRTNYGGGFGSFLEGFSYLKNGDVDWVGYGERADTVNKFAMLNTGPASGYTAFDTDPFFTTKPIALLTGDNAVSAGDFMPILFGEHPQVRTFGRPTAGAYGSYGSITLPDADYYGAMQQVNFFYHTTPNKYLNHTEWPVDFPMWWTTASICNGNDLVLDSAIAYIKKQTTTSLANTEEFAFSILPNPASTLIKILPAEDARVTIYSALGKAIINTEITYSNNVINCATLPNGIYQVKLQTKASKATTLKLEVRH